MWPAGEMLPKMQDELDRRVYILARRYLLGQGGISEELLDRHVRPSPGSQKPGTLTVIYERLLRSAQSAQSMPNVIGGSIGGIERLGTILFGFEPAAVARKYPIGGEG